MGEVEVKMGKVEVEMRRVEIKVGRVEGEVGKGEMKKISKNEKLNRGTEKREG